MLGSIMSARDGTGPEVLHEMSLRREPGVAMATTMAVTTVVFATRSDFPAHQLDIPRTGPTAASAPIALPIRPTRAARIGGSTDALGSLARPNGIADPRLWLILLALPLAARIAATATARITVPRHLWRRP